MSYPINPKATSGAGRGTPIGQNRGETLNPNATAGAGRGTPLGEPPTDEDYFGSKLSGSKQDRVDAVRELSDDMIRQHFQNITFSSSGGARITGEGGFFTVDMGNAQLPEFEEVPETEVTYRPFQVVAVADDTVQVKTGKFHSDNDGLWTLPTWDAGGFDTDYSPAGTEKLVMKVEIDASTGETTAVTIGWGLAVSHQVPVTDVTISGGATGGTTGGGSTTTSGGGSPLVVSTAHTNGEIRIDIAEVTVTGGEITNIEQFVDYNILLPWNGDIFYTFS